MEVMLESAAKSVTQTVGDLALNGNSNGQKLPLLSWACAFQVF